MEKENRIYESDIYKRFKKQSDLIQSLALSNGNGPNDQQAHTHTHRVSYGIIQRNNEGGIFRRTIQNINL